MPVPELPQELLDKIIDQLCETSTALHACALTAHSFRIRSQAHLFHTITLRPLSQAQVAQGGRSTICKKLQRLLVTSPQVASLVRRLVILDAEDPDPHRERYGDYAIKWVYNGTAALTAVLTALSGPNSTLESLVVSGHDRRMTWQTLPEQLKLALLGVLRVPGLRHVTFCLIYDYPWSALQELHNLGTLQLCDSFPESWVDPPRQTTPSRSHLESLTISEACLVSVSPLLHWLGGASPPFDLSSLKKFHFDLSQDGSSTVSAFLTQTTSLEELTLRFSGDTTYNFETDLHLNHHQTLHRVTFKFDFAQPATALTSENNQPLHRIAMVLQTAPSSLQDIAIELTFDFGHWRHEGGPAFTNGLMGSPASHWDALDVVLVGLAVRSVRVLLQVHNPPTESDFLALDTGTLRVNLPRVAASGVLLELVAQPLSREYAY